MKRFLIPVGLMAALAVPASAVAAPTKADRAEAKQECRQMQRTVETRANFVELVKLEAKTNRRNAFGRCVAVRTSDATGERRTAFQQAKAECASLRPGADGSRGKPSDPGAYGKCVSEAARKNQQESDAEQREESVNPAKTCRDRQKADPAAFTAKNAFGKCVSEEAQKQNDDKPAEEQPEQESGTTA